MKQKDIRFLMQGIYALFLLLIYCLNGYLLETLPNKILSTQIMPEGFAIFGTILVVAIFFIVWYLWMKFADYIAERFGK